MAHDVLHIPLFSLVGPTTMDDFVLMQETLGTLAEKRQGYVFDNGAVEKFLLTFKRLV